MSFWGNFSFSVLFLLTAGSSALISKSLFSDLSNLHVIKHDYTPPYDIKLKGDALLKEAQKLLHNDEIQYASLKFDLYSHRVVLSSINFERAGGMVITRGSFRDGEAGFNARNLILYADVYSDDNRYLTSISQGIQSVRNGETPFVITLPDEDNYGRFGVHALDMSGNPVKLFTPDQVPKEVKPLPVFMPIVSADYHEVADRLRILGYIEDNRYPEEVEMISLMQRFLRDHGLSRKQNTVLLADLMALRVLTPNIPFKQNLNAYEQWIDGLTLYQSRLDARPHSKLNNQKNKTDKNIKSTKTAPAAIEEGDAVILPDEPAEAIRNQ